jgi:hypothetical protein
MMCGMGAVVASYAAGYVRGEGADTRRKTKAYRRYQKRLPRATKGN